ncbi:hypothetical protein CerSpe_081990 [Prunus speciosa]
MAVRKPGVIALFDVDGTLTAPRKAVTPEMLGFIRELRKAVTVGIVGGSDLSKITEQLGWTGMQLSQGLIKGLDLAQLSSWLRMGSLWC